MHKHLLLLVFSLLFAGTLPAQTLSGQADAPEDNVYQVVDQMPEFPGGMEGLKTFLSDNLRYPRKAKRANIQGTVFVGFVVGRDGQIRDAQVLKGIGHGCDEEVVRVVMAMPAWKAGMHSGRTVAVRFALPVQFTFR
jgi:protein TonB